MPCEIKGFRRLDIPKGVFWFSRRLLGAPLGPLLLLLLRIHVKFQSSPRGTLSSGPHDRDGAREPVGAAVNCTVTSDMGVGA